MQRTPEQLGPYELIRPLGAGGMAETFLAVRRGPAGFEQRVCLKRILPTRAADPVFVELFLDEARLLARLQCQNIVHVHDFGEVDGCYYMALELVDGTDLEALLASLRARSVRMPEDVALYIVSELLVALSYAHGLVIDGEPQHIVHRDISPSNILISKQGEVKLTDFGIAKARGRTHRTEAGQTKGKVAYMSPEQLRAEELDGRSDLFAVGVVLFELLTGMHPFDATTDFALQVNIMSGKRRALRELLPEVRGPVAALIDALLAPDREARPADADAALAMIPQLISTHASQRALQQLMGPPPQAAPARAVLPSGAASAPRALEEVGARATTGLRDADGGNKSRLLPMIAVALVLLLGGGLAYALVQSSQTRVHEALRSDQPPPLPRPAAARPGASDRSVAPEPAPEATPKSAATGPASARPTTPARATTELAPVDHASARERPEAPASTLDPPADTEPAASERPHRERATGPRPSRRDEGTNATGEPDEGASTPAPGSPNAQGSPSPTPSTTSAPPAAGRALPPVHASTPKSRVIIAAPRDQNDAQEEARRKASGGTYVSPSGRVIMRAPPPK